MLMLGEYRHQTEINHRQNSIYCKINISLFIMKMFIVLIGMIAVTMCAPSIDSEVAARRALPALEHEEVHDEFGQYALRYVTAEGTVVSQRGRLVPTARGDYVLITEGEISFIGDDGELYITKFSAGLDGYHAETNHHPLAPEPNKPE